MEGSVCADVLLALGTQGLFILLVWRMSRRLYPLIDAMKDLDVAWGTGRGADAGEAAGEAAEVGEI